MEIIERVAYLKGLAEGMSLNTEKGEGKLLSAIIDVLEDVALELEDVWDAQAELADGLDAVSDDLEDVEDVVFEEYDEDDEDDDDFDEELDDMYETTCPKCGNTIRFDYEQAANEQLDCPNCGAHLEFSLEDDDAE